MTYLEWAAYHARLFGLGDAQSLETVRHWLPVLERFGYRPDELREASDWLVVHAAPRYWTEAPAALAKRIRDVRARSLSTGSDSDAVSRCQDCAGSGLLVVPDLRVVCDGEWLTERTYAIRCHCARGRSGNSTRPSDGRLQLGYDDYARANPRWREQMARKMQENRALREIG